MMINGTDYSLPLLAVLSFLVMFGVQFVLLRLKRPRFLRHLPWVWVILMLGVAIAALFGDTGGWIDIRTFFCALFCAYAAICAAGIGLAHLIVKRKIR